MDIGIDISPLQNGHRFRGIGSYTRGLLSGLAQLDTGDRYTLYYWKGLPLELDSSMRPASAVLRGISYPHVGRWSALLAQQILMVASLGAYRLDVYHQLGAVADPTAGAVPWALLGRSIVTVHDLTPLVYRDQFLTGKRVRRAIYRLVLGAVRRARHVVTDSKATQKDLFHLLGLRPGAVTVVPLAVSPPLMEAFQSCQAPVPPPGLPGSFMLTVAGDYPNKNLRTLLEAYGAIASDPAVPELLIVGPPGVAIDRFRRGNPVAASRLSVRERLSDSELAAVYRGAALVVVPSEYEGFGLPVLEAMAAGAPVIAANASSLPEVAGDAALLVPAHDPEAMADAMRCLCHSPETRARLCARGLERARQFSWEQTAAATYKVYWQAGHGEPREIAQDERNCDRSHPPRPEHSAGPESSSAAGIYTPTGYRVEELNR